MTDSTNEGPPIRITVSMGYTRNMGNFESARVDVGMSENVRPGENPSQAHARVSKWVESKVIASIKEMEDEISSLGSK